MILKLYFRFFELVSLVFLIFSEYPPLIRRHVQPIISQNSVIVQQIISKLADFRWLPMLHLEAIMIEAFSRNTEDKFKHIQQN